MELATEIDLLRAQALKDKETIALQAKTIATLAAKQEMLEVLVAKLVAAHRNHEACCVSVRNVYVIYLERTRSAGASLHGDVTTLYDAVVWR